MGYGSFQICSGPLDGQWGGYNIADTCVFPGCSEQIDRGLAHLCGDTPHGGGETGCGRFFCDGHLTYGENSRQCVTCAADEEPDADPISDALNRAGISYASECDYVGCPAERILRLMRGDTDEDLGITSHRAAQIATWVLERVLVAQKVP